MLPHASKFDQMIESLFAKYFHVDLTSAVNLKDILPGSRLDAHIAQQIDSTTG
jgi:hypothetical protein